MGGIRSGGLIPRRVQGAVVLRGDVDATSYANLPTDAVPGDTYKISVAGNFGNDANIAPTGAYFEVGDRVQRQISGKWLKADADDSIVDDAYGATWIGDTESAPSRDALYNKFEAQTTEYNALVQAEEDARIAADNTLQTNIDNEAATRIASDNTLQTNINDEAATRLNNDLVLQGNIDDEESARQSADATLQTNIDNEESSRQSADTTLQDNIDAEAATRLSDDNTLQDNIDSEASTRLANDNTLQGNIDSEAATRLANDNTLQSNIDAQGVTLQGNIDALANDTTLQDNIDAEEQARLDSDEAIGKRIDGIDDIVNKATMTLVDNTSEVLDMEYANRTSTSTAFATTYPVRTATGNTAVEAGLMDATENVVSWVSPVVLNFSGFNTATHIGIKRPSGVAKASMGIPSKVETSHDGSFFLEQDSESYFRGLVDAESWPDDSVIYLPVNKKQHPYVRITFEGYDSSSFSLSLLSFHGFAGTSTLEQWDFSPSEDIDPATLVTDNGDRWFYVTSDVGNFGASTQLIHESNFRNEGVMAGVSSISFVVNGGSFEGKVSTFARTMKLSPSFMEIRSGETFDFRGSYTINGNPISAGFSVNDDDYGLSWTSTNEAPSQRAMSQFLELVKERVNLLSDLADSLRDSDGNLIVDSAGLAVVTAPETVSTATFDRGDVSVMRLDVTGDHTISDDDFGKTITVDSSIAVTVTVPASLRSDFVCRVVQKGSGQVTFTGSATIRNVASSNQTSGQWAVVLVEHMGSGDILLSGGLV